MGERGGRPGAAWPASPSASRPGTGNEGPRRRSAPDRAGTREPAPDRGRLAQTPTSRASSARSSTRSGSLQDRSPDLHLRWCRATLPGCTAAISTGGARSTSTWPAALRIARRWSSRRDELRGLRRVGGQTGVSSSSVAETGAKSSLISEGRVTAADLVAATDEHRAFSSEDLAAMASEATISLEAHALADRPRRASGSSPRSAAACAVSSISIDSRHRRGDRPGARRLALLRAARDDTGDLPVRRAVGRPGRATDRGDDTSSCRSRTSQCDRRARAVSDVDSSPELDDPSLGGIERLRDDRCRQRRSTRIGPSRTG